MYVTQDPKQETMVLQQEINLLHKGLRLLFSQIALNSYGPEQNRRSM
jgi:hypothetical protein